MKRIWRPARFGLGIVLIGMLAAGMARAQDSGPGSSSAQPAGVAIDRMVAIVNDDPITERQILWSLALDPAPAAGPYSNRLKRRALEQYIDYRLLYQEAKKLPSIEVGEEEISRYIADLGSQFPSQPFFRRRLQTVGLDGRTLRDIARLRLVIIQFIEFRFRAFVFVSEDEIQSYYDRRVDQLAQELGLSRPPLDRIRELIEKNIVEEKVSSEMIAWFEDARRRADIVYLVRY